MTRDIPEAVLWCLLAVLLAVVVLLIRERRTGNRLRGRLKVLDADVRARDDEVRHLAAVRLPALMDSLSYRPGSIPGLTHGRLAGSSFAMALTSVIDLFGKSTENAQARADTSAKTALKSSMRALQGLANEQQLAISDMQDRHDDPDVLQDLLEIDHTNSQFGRRAQAIAVLCGSWPGRQRAASPLVDVVRGATSRIRDYRRVEVHSQVDVAVTSRAVEPVVLAVAELLDNAARHSQPNTSVRGQPPARAQRHRHRHRRRRRRHGRSRRSGAPSNCSPASSRWTSSGSATRRSSASRSSACSPTATASRVSVDTRSPYGGVRAVVFLPSALLTADPARRARPPAPRAARPTARADPGRTPARPRPRRGRPGPTARRRSPQHERRPGRGPEPDAGPPRRPAQAAPQSRRTARRPHRRTPRTAESDRTARPFGSSEAAAVIGAFARGTRSGRASAPDSSDHEGNSQE